MFTGIITDVGVVVETEQRGDLRARIKTAYDTSGIDIGASIACDGVCLTAIDLGSDWFDVDISAETLSKTNIGGADGWPVGKRVNLERSLKVGDELGGHIVSGHVDGVAELIEMRDEGDYGIDFSDGDVTKPSIIPRSWYRVRSSTNVKRIEGAFCFHSFPRQTI